MQITTIGLDIAKNMFQIHGIDAAEEVIVRKQLRVTGDTASGSADDDRIARETDRCAASLERGK